MVETISPALARRIALAAQGFGAARARGPGTRQFGLLLRRLGLLQIDSVNVFERSHYLPVFARLGAYDKARARQARPTGAASRSTGRTRHPSSPLETLPLLAVAQRRLSATTTRRVRTRGAHRTPRRWRGCAPSCREAARCGRARSSTSSNKRQGPWWGWSDVEARARDDVPPGRRGVGGAHPLRARVRACPSRCCRRPCSNVVGPAGRRDARAGVDLGAGARHRHARRPGRLLPVEAGGCAPRSSAAWRRRADAGDGAGLEPAAPAAPRMPGCRGGSRRRRCCRRSTRWCGSDARLRMFDFHYRIEIYTPQPEARLRLRRAARADRRPHPGPPRPEERPPDRSLRVQAAWAEPGLVPDDVPRIARSSRATAAWQASPTPWPAPRHPRPGPHRRPGHPRLTHPTPAPRAPARPCAGANSDYRSTPSFSRADSATVATGADVSLHGAAQRPRGGAPWARGAASGTGRARTRPQGDAEATRKGTAGAGVDHGAGRGRVSQPRVTPTRSAPRSDADRQRASHRPRRAGTGAEPQGPARDSSSCTHRTQPLHPVGDRRVRRRACR